MSLVPSPYRPIPCFHFLRILSLGGFALVLAGCGSSPSSNTQQPPPPATPAMAPTFALTGSTTLVHDPSIIYQAGVYYSLSTDPGFQNGQSGYIPILCSSDKLKWSRCGQVFTSVPQTVLNVFPNLTVFWAPDVSYFNGLYHVYYAASGFGQNHSLIGVATNTTMIPTDPAYKWVDQGIVLSSQIGDNFNAIDPSILVDTDATGAVTHIWLTYGSFWGGIFQREINPATGMLSTSNTAVVNLATRPSVQGDPIEGPNLVKHNSYYYLFVSLDFCCNNPSSSDNYKIAVGRSSSPQGPFVDQAGTPMLQGGGTVILESGALWIAPGGSTVLIDPVRGDLITYHALSVSSNYLDYLFVDTITWPSDWPAIQQ